MKKKLIVLVLIVALVSCIFMTSCTFIRKNEERQANEIMATVSLDYEDQTLSLTVSRNELISYVNYIINLYNQYGMTYDAKTLVEQGLDALISQKYTILNGMVFLMGLENRKNVMYLNTDEYKNVYGTKITPEGVLTMAERYSTIATTNETFHSNIETYIEEYNTEQRELLSSTARERLAALYADGYTVKENGTAVYHMNNDEYIEGLYQDSFIYTASSGSSETTVEVDYKLVFLQIKMEKSGADEEIVYLPVSSSSVTTEVDSEADFISNYITTKKCLVTYDEPVPAEDEDDEDSYKTHTAEATFTLVTPRTAYTEPTEEDTRDDAVKLIEGDVRYRYADFSGELSEELQKIVDEGQIFKHTLDKYESDAEKDAYRQFRDSKKTLLINFDASKTDDPYNTLGYYYLSGFESAILTAVQHELKRTALTDKPITDAQIEEQYKILVNKQAEEYEVLDNKAQIDKFAETIKTDLSSAYYVPIDAMLSETFEYNGNTYHYAERNEDGTYTINMFYISHILFKWTDELKAEMERFILDRDDEAVKEIKREFIEYLKTNKSKLEYATAEEQGTKLEDAFFVNEDGTVAEFTVTEVIQELAAAMAASDKPLEVFKEYMTYFNDDNGSMSSKVGYFVAMGDISHSYDGDDFPNMAKDLYLRMLKEGKNPNEDKELSDWAFTGYGLHLETISFAPFYKISLTEENGLGVNFKLDLDGTVFSESIKTNLESTVNTKEYSAWTAKFTGEEALANAVKNNKKMKSLLKQLGV